MADTDHFDMIVVGAGWHGLVAAKVYMELHPSEEVLVLEAENSCGGTWSKDRLYPGLKSNNLLDSYEYPDYPMDPETYGVEPGEHIPGPVLHRYLTDFAKEFAVYSRIRFSTKVESLEPGSEKGWQVRTTSNEKKSTFSTKKIIIATGLTSQPNFPIYPGSETFGKPYFHAKDFCRNGDTVNTTENVVVVGGGKSAFDTAYAYAAAGAHVDIVIRKEGKGPVWISYPWVMGGKKRLEKLLHVRWMTWFSPCPFGGVDGWGWVRNFLHGTAVGRFIVDKFWGGLGGEIIEKNGYAGKDAGDLAKLKPWASPMFTASGLSIHNYPQDLWEMVKKGKVNVRISDVERLSPGTVHLTDGMELKTDVLVCATGWRKDPAIRFTQFETGLPQTQAEQADLATAADEKILNLYPRLRNQPTLNFKPKPTPGRLYRFIVPPASINDRNIAFAGMVSSVSTANAANAQALWISAYLDGRLNKVASTEHEVTEEVMLHNQWGRWRYPYGYGSHLPDLAFDSLPYIDLLLNDLGLRVNRKAGMLADLTEPYGPRDFAGLVDEWVEGHANGGKKDV